MKEDGFAGGQLFCLATRYGMPDKERSRGSTDIHYIILCFTSATREPVLCAVILKTTKEIQDIPLSWKMGIDIRKDIYSRETCYEIFTQIVVRNKLVKEVNNSNIKIKKHLILLYVIQSYQ
jgi:hypothetical protein